MHDDTERHRVRWFRDPTFFVLGALSACLIIAALFMQFFTCWDAGTKASVYVAIGTIGLAVATFWSVYQTRAVISGEDRRHQNAYAPLVVCQGFPYESGSPTQNRFLACLLRNDGMGMALNITVDVKGRIQKRESTPGLGEGQHHSDFTANGTAALIPNRKDEHWASIFMLTLPDGFLALDIHRVAIQYEDQFGNLYETLYQDWQAKPGPAAFDEWRQPQYLKIPRSSTMSNARGLV